MNSKILYLYASLAENGIGHIWCRKLMESLSAKHQVTPKYAIIKDEHYENAQPSLLEQTVSESDFKSAGFEVLIIEGDLGVRSDAEAERVSASILKDFIDGGGIIFFMFSEVNRFINGSFGATYNAFLHNAAIPGLRTPRNQSEYPDYQGQASDSTLIYGFDDKRSLHNDALFKITIDDHYKVNLDVSVRQAFHGVSTLVVNYPIQVEVSPALSLLTGNHGTTRMLSTDDYWWDGDIRHVPASYYDMGRGVSAILTGNMFDDKIVTAYQTDAILYFHNILNLFINRQRSRRKLLSLPQIVAENQLKDEPKALDLEDEGGKKYEELVSKAIEKIHETILQFSIDITRKNDSEEFLRLALKNYWDRLEPASRIFLTMGESIFRVFKDEKGSDFAAAAIEYAKCVENELNTKIILAFKDYLEISGIAKEMAKEWDEARYKGDQGLRAVEQITKSSIFMMGDMEKFFRNIPYNEKLNAAFKTFLGASGYQEFWVKDAPDIIKLIRTRYRNGSAHTKVMIFDLCSEWRSLLLGLDAKEGIMNQIFGNLPMGKKQ